MKSQSLKSVYILLIALALIWLSLPQIASFLKGFLDGAALAESERR